MAKKFRLEDYYTFKNVTPRSLEQDNLVFFSYHSPNGVHDKTPLVYVLEKQLDRFYGLNLHYDSLELQEVIQNIQVKTNTFLEKEWYKKYPEKKKQLKESKAKFTKQLLEPKDLKEFSNRFPKRDLEKYVLKRKNTDTMRCYLYVRMNQVSKLIFKI